MQTIHKKSFSVRIGFCAGGILLVGFWCLSAVWRQAQANAALIAGIKADDPQAVALALSHGADPECTDNSESTELFWMTLYHRIRGDKETGDTAVALAEHKFYNYTWEEDHLPPEERLTRYRNIRHVDSEVW